MRRPVQRSRAEVINIATTQAFYVKVARVETASLRLLNITYAESAEENS
jgi:hypothetical protein